MKVLVLGCGPAGLVATWAAEQRGGTEVVILSRKRPSPLYGCQYLHQPIPDLTVASVEVDYRLNGTCEQYARKVYGVETPTVSPQLYDRPHPAWDLRGAYAWLWNRYEDLIVEAELTALNIHAVMTDFKPDRVVVAVPRPVLCQAGGEHLFRSQRCWAIGDALELGQEIPYRCPENTVLCDGTSEMSWYRLAKVFGFGSVEWSSLQRKPPISGVVSFQKPLSTTCNCWPDWHFVGRYGRWQKGVLVHDAYGETLEYLNEKI
jgi:hypothetical protein